MRRMIPLVSARASVVLALEPVAVEQGQEELEVLLLAGVRGGGHQQQVPGDLAEQLAELEALGLLAASPPK